MTRILLVEDNPVFRESLKESIYYHFPAVDVEEAGSGEDALQKVSANPVQLIFMDIRLPGMNGLQATRSIRSAFPDTRVVVLTGYDLPEYREAALNSGADQFLVKESVKWKEIEALIRSVQ